MFQQNERLGSALEQKVQVRCCLGFFWLVVFFSFKVECFASLLKTPSAVNQNLWEICPSLEPGLCFLACEPRTACVGGSDGEAWSVCDVPAAVSSRGSCGTQPSSPVVFAAVSKGGSGHCAGTLRCFSSRRELESKCGKGRTGMSPLRCCPAVCRVGQVKFMWLQLDFYLCATE